MSRRWATRGRFGREPSPIRLLQYTAFVSTFDRFAMAPMLVAIALDLGEPLSDVVQAAAAYFLAYGLMQPVWGMVSDSLGRVRTLRVTLLLAGVTTAASAVATSALTLGVFRGLAGGFIGAAFPAALIYVGDTVPAARRQSQVTRLMAGFALGTALASAGAGILANVASWRLAFLLTGLAAVSLAVGLRRLPEPAVTRSHRGVVAPVLRVLRSPSALMVLVFVFTEGAIVLGTLTMLPSAVESTGVSSSVAGTITAAYGVALFASARLVGRLSLRLHPSALMGLGGTSALLGCTLMAWSQEPLTALVVAALLGLCWAGMHSSLQTWATEVLPEARATVVSLFSACLFMGSAVAAVLVSGLADEGRYRIIFVIAAIATIPLSLLSVWARATWRRPEEKHA